MKVADLIGSPLLEEGGQYITIPRYVMLSEALVHPLDTYSPAILLSLHIRNYIVHNITYSTLLYKATFGSQ